MRLLCGLTISSMARSLSTTPSMASNAICSASHSDSGWMQKPLTRSTDSLSASPVGRTRTGPHALKYTFGPKYCCNVSFLVILPLAWLFRPQSSSEAFRGPRPATNCRAEYAADGDDSSRDRAKLRSTPVLLTTSQHALVSALMRSSGGREPCKGWSCSASNPSQSSTASAVTSARGSCRRRPMETARWTPTGCVGNSRAARGVEM
mmetsp:Transcript_19498/g.46564  ORF Transcript_19498/g.46564 Transcript_19498/m.46564 type:complete len:206 (+) Transcript_19498:907-1524(+)